MHPSDLPHDLILRGALTWHSGKQSFLLPREIYGETPMRRRKRWVCKTLEPMDAKSPTGQVYVNDGLYQCDGLADDEMCYSVWPEPRD